MRTIWLNDWSKEYVTKYSKENTPLKQMISDFEITKKDLEGIHILLADYTYEDYSGNAFVLFEKEGKLYEVNGGHCSCYGLEGQWNPEEVLLEELAKRVESHYNFDGCRDEMRKLVKKLLKNKSNIGE